MSLADQIHAFQPIDDRERRARETILEHIAAHPDDPFSRDHLAGHLTASALVVSADGERVLLGHHRKLGRWLQFGGHGDPGETDAADVAIREALEESGIEGLKFHPTAPRPFDLDVHTIPARGDIPEHKHLDIRYLVVAPADAVPVIREAEHLELRWFTWDQSMELEVDPALDRLFGKGQELSLGPRRREALNVLRRMVHKEFADVKPPPHDLIGWCDGECCASLISDLRMDPEAKWEDLSHELIEVHQYDLRLMTPKSLPFFLPAWMGLALDGWSEFSDYVWGVWEPTGITSSLPSLLCPNGGSREPGRLDDVETTRGWFQDFTSGQRATVYAFLEFSAEYGVLESEREQRKSLGKWFPHLAAQPSGFISDQDRFRTAARILRERLEKPPET